MNNFFVNSGIDYTQTKESTSNSEWNSKDSFFTNQDENIYVKTAKETPDISKENCNGFFTNKTDVNNFIRNYSRGKSFKFSIWNEVDTYNNDNFVQDFVQWNQKLWAAKKTSTNIPPTQGEYWELVVEGVSNIEFKYEENGVWWKYEDSPEWKVLLEMSSVSDDQIKNMLDEIFVE